MRKPVRALALLCAILLSSLAGAQTQPRTWRLDFYETGGPGIEAYSFDRLVIEPLAWPDNPAANVEPQPKAIVPRLVRLFETRLIHHTKIVPSIVP